MTKSLTAKRIAVLRKPGRYRDPETRGLYLQVGRGGSKSWLLKYQRGQHVVEGEVRPKEYYMGLGSFVDFSLKEARERARAARQKLADGIDPIEAKRAERAARALAAEKRLTFEQAAREYHRHHEAKWKNRKVATQWLTVMEHYAFPILGKLLVNAIDTGLVLRVLEQSHKSGKALWLAVPETAGRVRQRLENVLDWAGTRGHRAGENPARWRGHLANVLPAQGQISTVNHHPALPYERMPEFWAALAERQGVAARALEFTILTAARTGETIGARWAEIDLKAKIWIVPAERMKARKEHRVPLSDRAVEILKALPTERGNEYVFIGPSKGAGLSNMAMASVLKRMARTGVTVHGFRSSFMDWAHERTSAPKAAIDMALAHTVGDKVEAAYRRGDLLGKRTRLMGDWARHCTTPAATGEVVPMRVRA